MVGTGQGDEGGRVMQSIPPLACHGVSVRFGGLAALTDVDVSLARGTVTGLIGPNGAGKSTLVNVLSGYLRPHAGDVVVRGATLRRPRLSAFARAGVSRSFQQSRILPGRTVREHVELGALGATHADAVRAMELLRLDVKADEAVESLSYGEARRLGVAIALAARPEVLLLDEPGAGLSESDLGVLAHLLRDLAEDGVTSLLVDHNMRFLMGAVEQVVVLDGGRVLCTGTPSEVQSDPGVRAAYLGSVAC